MKYTEHLAQNKKRLTNKWLTALIETYPAESGRFLFNRKNEFTNPIGHAYEKGLGEIFDALFCGKRETLDQALTEIMKIRSIQDYSASYALNFMFILKGIIQDEFKAFSKGGSNWQELTDALEAADEGMKAAFDMFVKQREILYEIKANEIKNRTFRMIDRLNKKYDVMDEK